MNKKGSGVCCSSKRYGSKSPAPKKTITPPQRRGKSGNKMPKL